MDMCSAQNVIIILAILVPSSIKYPKIEGNFRHIPDIDAHALRTVPNSSTCLSSVWPKFFYSIMLKI